LARNWPNKDRSSYFARTMVLARTADVVAHPVFERVSWCGPRCRRVIAVDKPALRIATRLTGY
jgi:hypothetical protein